MTVSPAPIVAERIRRPIPAGSHVLAGSLPVVSFGDPDRAVIATLSLNPSWLEFQSLDGSWLLKDQRRLASIPPGQPGTDLLTVVVLGPLFTEGFEGDLNVYFGQRRSSSAISPFSFFPARLALDAPPLFARPELRPVGALRDRISPGNMQGIKLTRDLTAADCDAVWAEVVEQIAQQGCALGHHAQRPPLVDLDAALSVSRQPPDSFNQRA